MGPIANMHVDKDAPVRFVEHDNDRVEEELDEVANELGEENGDGNDRGEGGATSAADGGNNDADSFPVGMVDPVMFPKNFCTKEAPNQGVEIQDNPPSSYMNINSRVPNFVIPIVNNTDEEDNAPLNHMYTNDTQDRLAFIGITLVGLG
jgi:hypothetical protein